ncbi:MAG: hypothetical protein HY684_06840 [Chloroflexi bacterium]|nr:hypothetical protein [Chloroflexota bacterium]
MTRWTRRVVTVTILLVALALGMMPQHVAHADDPVKIRVELTDGGFNGKGDDFTIDVEQGKLVELTFVWAHKAFLRDEHIMVLQGYKLESEKLTAEHREATFKFIADKPGTFNFKCDLDCEVHDALARGYLKVGRGVSGGGAAALTPTSLTVSPSSWATDGDTVTLMATLKDAKGAPVSKAEVLFLLDAEFVGAKSKMEIGAAKTDANGVAFLEFKPTLAVERYAITARFEGMGVYGESQQAIEIQALGTPPPAYVMEPVGLGIIPSWAAPLMLSAGGQSLAQQVASRWPTTALALAVLAIWAILGFILYQAFSISRARNRR